MSIDNEYIAMLCEFALFSENSCGMLFVPVIILFIQHTYLTTILHFSHLISNFISHVFYFLFFTRKYAGLCFLIGFPAHATPVLKRGLFYRKEKANPQRMKFAC